MKIRCISGPPSPAMARALAEFEVPFTYPLGPGRFFRITHGEDYTLFFRTMGEEAYFVAEHQDKVVGVLGTSVRRLSNPQGAECAVAYLGDLKISAGARGGLVLGRLARAAQECLRPRVAAAYGVVMGGTASSPDAYTGRAGIPAFQELGRLIVLRLSVERQATPTVPLGLQAAPETGAACYRELSRGRYASPPVEALKRSQIRPVWLMKPDGSACGMLEDTRKAKRLIDDDGSEMVSGHLSYFAFKNAAAGVELVRAALGLLPSFGLPALFVAVCEPDSESLCKILTDVCVLPAAATVFGTGLIPGLWNINSAEI
jgi:hypothetical protein